MIVDNGKYYLYRHVRVDTNEPFYIGIGKKCKADLAKGRHLRSSNTRQRSNFWKYVVAKTDYISEILIETDDENFIQEKETEFIKLYGRKDLGTGSLVNLTDGGRQGLNKSSLSIERQLNTAKKNGTYQEAIDRMIKFSFKKGVNNGYQDKITYLYSIEGWFIKDFKTREELAACLDTHAEEITKCIKTKISHKGYFFSNEKINRIDLNKYKARKDKTLEVCKICKKTGEVLQIYNSMVIASKDNGVDKSNIWNAIDKLHSCNGFFWSYRETHCDILDKLNNKYSLWGS